MGMSWTQIVNVLGITEDDCLEERMCRETYEEYYSLTNNFQRFIFLWKNRRNHYMNDTIPSYVYDFIWWWDQQDIRFEIKMILMDVQSWFKK